MPPQSQQQSKPTPDFIPADPDFIPADSAALHAAAGYGTAQGAPPSQPGILDSISNAAQGAVQNIKDHPVRSAIENLPGVPAIMGAYQGGKRILGELQTGEKAAGENKGAESLLHQTAAIPVIGPRLMEASEATPPTKPGQSYMSKIGDAASTPGVWKPVIEGAAEAAPLALGGIDAAAGGRVGIGALPSKTRAIESLAEVSQAAKDVPLQLKATEPAIGDFRQYVATGGRGTPVVNKLVKRIATAGEENPINFPEGRQFYTNISRATARPGFLRRAIESPVMPDLRRNLGGVREAMNSDLTDAANSVGMGDKYTQGIKEYANAAKLNRGLKIGGAIATEEALRRSGILGKVASGAANMAGR